MFKEEHLKEGRLIKSKEWDNCAGGGLSGKNIAFLSSDHNGNTTLSPATEAGRVLSKLAAREARKALLRAHFVTP